MKKLFYTLVASGCSIISYAQTPAIQWQKTIGGSNLDQAKSIKQTNDDGYIVVGNSSSIDGDVTGNHSSNQTYLTDFWIVKLNSSGVIQWQKALGGSSIEEANSVQQTSDGGYIVAGTAASSDGDVTGGHGSFDDWIIKLDSSGNIQWKKTLGGSMVEHANSIRQTTDNGYIIAGYSNSVNGDITGNHGSEDFWIVKLDQSGNLQWQKSLGGSDKDSAYSIQQTYDGGYITIGVSLSTNGDVTGNHGNYDIWVVKLNASGSIQWQKSLGGSNDDTAYTIRQTSDGGYIFAGTSSSNNGDVNGNAGSNMWIVKLNNTGNIQWKKIYGTSEFYEVPLSIIQTSDHNYVIGINKEDAANSKYNVTILKIDSAGNSIWEKNIDGNPMKAVSSLEETTDGGLIFAGYADDYTDSNFLIVKLAPTGTLATAEVNQHNTSTAFYPNPAKDFITASKLPKGSTVSIFDTSGRKVFQEKLSTENTKIKTEELLNGTYIIIVTNEGGTTILSDKIIIRR